MAVFEKGIRLRHIGHLDIQRAMMRALRRSGLPVAYSNGYNPHILLTFASALSTGAAGKKEILDVTMAREVSPDDFLQQMNRALPPDLQLSFARALDDKHPAMMALVLLVVLIAGGAAAFIMLGKKKDTQPRYTELDDDDDEEEIGEDNEEE